jgi:hypothetical protein
MPQVRRPRPLASPQGSPQAADQSSAARRTTRAARAGEVAMTVSIPLVAILGVAVFVAYRYMDCESGRPSCACCSDSYSPPALRLRISATL